MALSIRIDQDAVMRSVKEMSRAARRWADKDLSKAMTKASKAAAAVAVPFVQRETPVDTGKLQKNIKSTGTRTIPKVKAGTKTKGGPYAWMVHKGHGNVPGVPYMRKGIKKAFPKVIAKYAAGQKEAAKIFNESARRKASQLEKIKI